MLNRREMELIMPEYVYVPVEAQLCADIIRFSDGELDPFRLANDQLRNFVERTVAMNWELWGDRAYEVAEKYAPEVLEQWSKQDERRSAERRENNRPLVWKDVSVPAES